MHTKNGGSLLISTILVLLAVGALGSLAVAQNSHADWQTLSPEGEEFSVVMPKDPKFMESEEPYHRDMTLKTRLYLSGSEHGPILAVASLSGIKASGLGANDFLRLNSYVDAFKNWFPQKVRKDAVARLTLVGDKTVNGHLGREYKVVIGDLSGTARVFATRRRFYAAVVLNVKKDDDLTDQFLSSFLLPEKMAQQQEATVAAVPTPNTRNPKEKPEDPQKVDPASGTALESKTDDNAANAVIKAPHAPVSGGILNSKATFLGRPDVSTEVHGTVMVQVLVDETGAVITATAVSGPELVRQACVNAALASRFTLTSVDGEAVKVMGIIQYNFGNP